MYKKERHISFYSSNSVGIIALRQTMGGTHSVHRSTKNEILIGKPEPKILVSMAEYKNGS
jgi:hypothetical protein